MAEKQALTLDTVSSALNKPVFYISSGVILVIMLFAAIWPHLADQTFKAVQALIVDKAGWYYILTVAILLICTIVLAVSRAGRLRLGPDHSRPDYSTVSWFAMLFSAGMGIGLMFFGVAEPVMHYLAPPVGDPHTVEAAKQAMRLTFFHWGLHAWGIYAIVALILAFFSFRHNLPLTLRSALYPLIGNRIYGPIGHAVDIFAVVGTLFGVATSLGYGVLQVNAGLNHLFTSIPVNIWTQIVLIVVITAMATLSVTSGLDRGVKFLSELNLGVAVVLLFTVLLIGPTVFLLSAFVQNVGDYASHIIGMTFNLFAYQKTDWLGGWTILYWGWWLSWAPFVGLFIARVSRGRTIREFVIGVLLIPSGFTFIWMTVFGNSAIDMIANQGITALGEVVSKDVSIALFYFFEQMPFSKFLDYVGLFMVLTFFVTSADSGALVMDMLCTYGHGTDGINYRIYWSVGAGLSAMVLLIVGGLSALQTMAIVSALPFVTVLMVALVGLFKALRIDLSKRDAQRIITATSSTSGGEDWRERLESMMSFPDEATVRRFVNTICTRACREVASEFNRNGIVAQVDNSKDGEVTLVTNHGQEIDFSYHVIATHRDLLGFISNSQDTSHATANGNHYYRAEVFLSEGGQNYDVMGWTKTGIINNILDQYQKHIHFLHNIR